MIIVENINMTVFDGHSDIFSDVTIRRLNGERNVLNTHHLERLKKGGVGGSIFVIWIDPPYDKLDLVSYCL